MKSLDESRMGCLLHSLAEAVFHHPRSFFYTQVLLVLVCLIYTASTLRFSTDRNDLISAKESYRRQFLEFKKEFEIHDNLFVLVESEDREKSREFVERLAAELRGDSEFAAVYYRGGLKLMGPKALLFLPEETLANLRRELRTYQPLFQALSQATNLDTLFGLFNRQFRLRVTIPSESSKDGMLSGSLLALRRVVDSASDCIESRERPLVPDLTTLFERDQDGQDREAARRELYITFDRGRIHVLIAQAKNPNQEGDAIKLLRKRIARTQLLVPGVNAEITGEAVLRHDEMEQARHDTEAAALISLALTALIFIGSCREILRPLMASFCLVMGICYTLGFATLTVGRLNILSITLVPILIGLAIDYGVHLIFRYEEEVRRGQSRLLAINKAMGLSGLGVITNAVTIAGAFYFMVLTDFKGMQEMGLIAGTGVMVCLVPMFTVLPLLLVRSKRDVPGRGTARSQHTRRSPMVQLFQRGGFEIGARRRVAAHGPRTGAGRPGSLAGRFGKLVLERPWLVLVCGAVFTVFTIFQSFKLQFDYNLLNLQSRGLPAVRMQKQLVRAGSQSLLYCAVIADSLPQAAEWEERIKQLPSVARVISLVKYLTEEQERKLAFIHEIKQELGTVQLPGLDARRVELPDLNQTLFSLSGYLGRAIDTLQSTESSQPVEELLRSLRESVRRLRRLTGTELASTADRLTAFQQALFGSLYETVSLIEQQADRDRLQPADVPAFLRAFFISQSGKFLLQVYPKEDVWQRDRQEEFIRQLRTVDPNVTGSPVQFYEYTSRLRSNIEKSAVYAVGIIAILVFLHFRRFSSVLLALLPMALGFCWMLGLMGWLEIPFNPVNIMSLILVIGIGVTSGVHILNRFAEEPHSNILARSTAKAVLVSGLNTMAGFGSLLVAKHQGIASLGGVMALGTGTCVVASLALLPAVLTLLLRRGWRPTDPPERKRSSSTGFAPK